MDSEISKNLKKYAAFKSEEDIIAFDQLLSQVCEDMDPAYVDVLFNIFDDKTNFPEVMYGVVHVLEDYPDEVYIISLLGHINFLYKKAPLWLLRLVYGILNEPSSLSFFQKNMHLIDKKDMLKLLDLAAKESEAHRPLIRQLKDELNKG